MIFDQKQKCFCDYSREIARRFRDQIISKKLSFRNSFKAFKNFKLF